MRRAEMENFVEALFGNVGLDFEVDANALIALPNVFVLAGTLGISKEVPVGFEIVRGQFLIDAPEATAEQLRGLKEKTEQYCVVFQTMPHPPKIETLWNK